MTSTTRQYGSQRVNTVLHAHGLLS